MADDLNGLDVNGDVGEEEEEDGQEPPQKKLKRFQCSHCQRCFARLEHLQRHERTRKFDRLEFAIDIAASD
jgi:uncharacterized Zn-finger protein